MHQFYIPYGFYQNLLTKPSSVTSSSQEIDGWKKELAELRDEVSELKRQARSSLPTAKRKLLQRKDDLQTIIDTMESLLKKSRRSFNESNLISSCENRANLLFPEGIFKYRKIASYPDGYIVYEKVDSQPNVRNLQDLIASTDIPDEGCVRVDDESKLTPLLFGKNGDLLQNYDPIVSEISKEFVCRELLADSGFLRCLVSPAQLRYFLEKLGFRSIKEKQDHIMSDIIQFLSVSQHPGQPVGFANSKNRETWLNNTRHGIKNWRGYAIKSLRGNIKRRLMHELSIPQEPNYPNKSYRKLIGTACSVNVPMAAYLGPLFESAKNEMSLVPHLDSYQGKKKTKLLCGSYFSACREQIQLRLNDSYPGTKGWNNIRELAAAVVVLGFDLFLYLKETKCSLPSELSDLAKLRCKGKGKIKFSHVVSCRNLDKLVKWLPTREEVSEHDQANTALERGKKKAITNMALIEELAREQTGKVEPLHDALIDSLQAKPTMSAGDPDQIQKDREKLKEVIPKAHKGNKEHQAVIWLHTTLAEMGITEFNPITMTQDERVRITVELKQKIPNEFHQAIEDYLARKNRSLRSFNNALTTLRDFFKNQS